MHGWFSEKQKKACIDLRERQSSDARPIIYLNEKNEKIEVTEVTRTKEYSSKFDDVIYLGILKEQVCTK